MIDISLSEYKEMADHLGIKVLISQLCQMKIWH